MTDKPKDRTGWTKQRRRAQGEKAQAGGKLWQDTVEGQLQLAQQSGLIARFVHEQPLFRPVGGGRFMPVARSGADFAGFLRGGAPLGVEAKHADDRRFYRREVAEKQQQHLQAVVAAGGCALLALRFAGANGSWLDFAVPWDRVPWVQLDAADAAPSVDPDDLDGWRWERPMFMARHLRRCPGCGATLVLGQQLALFQCTTCVHTRHRGSR